ncbi:MAG: ribonuclease P protein component [Methylovirgula sp.]
MREPRTTGGEEDIRPKSCQHPPARLKKRADFLKAASGQRAYARSFSLQAVRRKGEAEAGPPRFGFTVTKKIGGAVLRNRVRRRLKEALRLAAPDLSARSGYDYVILGRQAVLDQAFPALQEELARAIAEVHARPKAAPARSPRPAKARRSPVAVPANMKD